MESNSKLQRLNKTRTASQGLVNTIQLYFAILVFASILMSGCNDKIDEPTINSLYNLYRLDRIASGENLEWKEVVNASRGSVGRRGSGSKTIWSRKNEYGLGIYISANHVYNISGWPSKNSEVFNLFEENRGIFESSQLPPASGSLDLGNTLVSDFPFLHFDISAQATNTSLLPEEDIYLGLMDGQRVTQSTFPQYPEKLRMDMPLPLYDPLNRSISPRTWDNAQSGELVFGIGYPLDRPNFPNGAVAIGKVLSHTEAGEIIKKLKSSGDSEGDILYKPDVEFFMDAQGIAGMSGGGVFNKEGKLLGIMVRASDQESAPKIIRVVRIEFIKSKIAGLFSRLQDQEKNLVQSFLSEEMKFK